MASVAVSAVEPPPEGLLPSRGEKGGGDVAGRAPRREEGVIFLDLGVTEEKPDCSPDSASLSSSRAMAPCKLATLASCCR